MWSLSNPIFSQKKMVLTMLESDLPTNQLQKYELVDSLDLRQAISKKMDQLIAEGYSNPHLDTIIISKDTCQAIYFRSRKYTIGQIYFTPEQKTILEESGQKRTKLSGKIIDEDIIKSFLTTLVQYYTNTGYPFAKTQLDSVHFENEKMMAHLVIDKGNLVKYDSLQLNGKLSLSKHFLKRYLDIKPGERYNHAKILQAGKRLNDLQYAKQSKDFQMRFVNDKAIPILHLDPRPASRFDFLIGVLPQVLNGQRKFNISVDMTAELNNSFSQGEYTFFQIKRLKPENLELQAKSTIPYILSLPVGSTIDFRIFKNGTQNIDVSFDGGLQYLFGGFNNLKIYASYRSSRLLDIDTLQIINSKKLPSQLDLDYTGFGAGLSIRNLDYRFNPSKGYTIELNGVLGIKKIVSNITITQLEGFENAYDTLKVNHLQTDLDLKLAYYQPVTSWSTFKISGQFGLRYNQAGILKNEQLRLGGIRTIRGFDEESILTDYFSIGTLEYRILFDQNSYMSLPFIDYGFTNVDIDGKKIKDKVLGVGMGLNFGTPAGIFNISFAAGRNLGNPLDFSKMKIHFGYVNLF